MRTREGYIAVAEAPKGWASASSASTTMWSCRATSPRATPTARSGEWAARTAGECLDQLATLAFLAARTERLGLLTSVMVVPQRQPVLTAKMLATIDILSNGRLIVGCGVGWMKEEFEALGAPPFAERGRATDEYLDAFKALWTAGRARVRGQARQLRRPDFRAQAGRKPHPPIWIGGESGVALKRTVRVGDGWYPASNNPQLGWTRPRGWRRRGRVAQDRAGRRARSQVDRHRLPGALAGRLDGAQIARGRAPPFTGSSADMAADAATLAKSACATSP